MQMKKSWFVMSFTMMAVLTASGLWAQDAQAIVRASRDRIQADTLSTRSRMVITAKNGSTTERRIDQYSKDDAQGNARTVIVFQSPKSVAGTRFLTMDKAGGKSDQWIYLPELGKVRRIAAAEGGGSFMGTDMSYDDIASTNRAVEDDTHRLLREEDFAGALCYVIESVPKDSSYQYSRMISWIDQKNSVSYKIELYDKKGVLTKTMESSDFQDKQGRLTPLQTKVSTVNAGTYTTIFTEIVKYDDPVPEGVFTTKYLETGRPAK